MTPKKLAKLRRQLQEFRRSARKARDVERLAQQLGRRKRKGRGKEPMWESSEFPELFVLAIPHHGGRDLAPGTLRSILDQLEQDVFAWERKLDATDDQDSDDDEEPVGGSDDSR